MSDNAKRVDLGEVVRLLEEAGRIDPAERRQWKAAFEKMSEESAADLALSIMRGKRKVGLVALIEDRGDVPQASSSEVAGYQQAVQSIRARRS